MFVRFFFVGVGVFGWVVVFWGWVELELGDVGVGGFEGGVGDSGDVLSWWVCMIFVVVVMRGFDV